MITKINKKRNKNRHRNRAKRTSLFFSILGEENKFSPSHTNFAKQNKVLRKERSSLRRFASACVIGFLILLITGFLIFTNVNIARRRAELTERAEELRKEIQILEQKNQELQAKIIQAEELDFLEEKAREKLGLKRPGEEVIVILPIEEDVEEPVEEEKSFWEKIWNWFEF